MWPMLRMDGVSVAYLMSSSYIRAIHLLGVRIGLLAWCITSWIASSLSPRASYPFVYLTYQSFLVITIYFGLQIIVSLCHLPLLRQLHHDVSLAQLSLQFYESSRDDRHGRCGIKGAPLMILSPADASLIATWATRPALWQCIMAIVNMFHLVITPVSWFVTLIYWGILSSSADDVLAFVNLCFHATNSIMMTIEMVLNRMQLRSGHLVYLYLFGLYYTIVAFINYGVSNWWVYSFMDYNKNGSATTALYYLLMIIMLAAFFFLHQRIMMCREYGCPCGKRRSSSLASSTSGAGTGVAGAGGSTRSYEVAAKGSRGSSEHHMIHATSGSNNELAPPQQQQSPHNNGISLPTLASSITIRADASSVAPVVTIHT